MLGGYNKLFTVPTRGDYIPYFIKWDQPAILQKRI